MPRKRDEALHAARQQQILKAAKRCFVVNGFHQTSMRQILDAAGISSGAAYNYFAGKSDIVKALVEEERSDIELVLSQLEASDDPLEGIAQFVFDCIRYTSHEDAVLALEIYAECCRTPEIKELDQANTDEMRKALRKAISIGSKEGTISTQFPVNDVVEWLLALISGYIGRVADDKALSPQKAGKMAKRSVFGLLRV